VPAIRPLNLRQELDRAKQPAQWSHQHAGNNEDHERNEERLAELTAKLTTQHTELPL